MNSPTSNPTLNPPDPNQQLLCEAALRLAAAARTSNDVQREVLTAMARVLIDMTEAK